MKYNFNIDLNEDNSHTRIIKLIGRNQKVLEIGCATGYMSKMLTEEFKCDVTGVEVSAEAAQKAKEVCAKVIIGDIEELDLQKELEPKAFDVVIFADVLEHLRDPWEALRKVSIFLKDDGFIVASIPNVAHAAVILGLAQGDFTYRPLGLLDDTHIRFFTKRSIYELFEKTGYVISLIDRLKVPPEFTEIKIPSHVGLDEIKEYLYKMNDDAETYQFIIKAFKSSETGIILKLKNDIENLQEQVREQIRQKEEQIRQKEFMIQWLQNSRSWRITAPLRWLSNTLNRMLNYS